MAIGALALLPVGFTPCLTVLSYHPWHEQKYPSPTIFAEYLEK